MLDKTIDSALLSLRRQIILKGGVGLGHVEALLEMREIPVPTCIPRDRSDAARRGMMRVLLLEGLRNGRDTQSALAAYVHGKRPDLAARAAYVRTTQALQKMKASGLVVRDGKVWRLT